MLHFNTEYLKLMYYISSVQLMALNSNNPQMLLQNQLAAAAVAAAQTPPVTSPIPGLGSLSPQEMQVNDSYYFTE